MTEQTPRRWWVCCGSADGHRWQRRMRALAPPCAARPAPGGRRCARAEPRAPARQASDAAAREQLEKVVEVLVTERCTSMEDCIEWARKKFQARRRRPPRRL